MKVKILKKDIILFSAIVMFLMIISIMPAVMVSAEEAAPISFGRIDYDKLTMTVYNNNNSAVYYSTDKNTWFELEGSYDSITNSYSMDISWVSNKSDVTLYFKGDNIKTIKSITLPEQNDLFKVAYDKADGEFTFSNVDAAETFEWRKSTDYSWTTVKLEEDSASYIAFINTMESLRVMGAKIYIRTPQKIGTGSNSVGYRPSKEVAITITKRSNAPSIKVNTSKLTLNTSSSIEYYDPGTSLWIECMKTMSVEDLAPEVLYKNGSKKVTLMFRKAATSASPYSKTAYLTITGQAGAPVIGDNSSDVTYYYMNSKLVMQFHKASEAVKYEYAVVKPGYTFNLSSASWKTVSNSKLMTISKSSAPEGCRIYLRKKGIDANISKNIDLVLPSATSNFTVKYPS